MKVVYLTIMKMKNYIILVIICIICIYACDKQTFYYDIKKEHEIAQQGGYASYYMASRVITFTNPDADSNLEGYIPLNDVSVSVSSVSKNDPRLVGDIFFSGESDETGFLKLFSVNKNINLDKHIEAFCIPNNEYHNTYIYISVTSNTEEGSDVLLQEDSYISMPLVVIPKSIITISDGEGNVYSGVSAIGKFIPNAGGNLFIVKIGFIARKIINFPQKIEEKNYPNYYFEAIPIPYITGDEVYINGEQVLNEKHFENQLSVIYAMNMGTIPAPDENYNVDTGLLNMYIPDSGVITTQYKNPNFNLDYTVRVSAVRNINDEVLMVYFIGLFCAESGAGLDDMFVDCSYFFQ